MFWLFSLSLSTQMRYIIVAEYDVAVALQCKLSILSLLLPHKTTCEGFIVLILLLWFFFLSLIWSLKCGCDIKYIFYILFLLILVLLRYLKHVHTWAYEMICMISSRSESPRCRPVHPSGKIAFLCVSC